MTDASVIGGHDHGHDDHHHAPQTKGLISWIKRWVTTTNHKDIGTLYLIFSLAMFFLGGAMALGIRAELYSPGLGVVKDPNFFNALTTNHALIMVFGVVMPAFTGLANWMIPMMVGAPDMALPRMNNWSFWILPFAFSMLTATWFMPGGAPAAGWTFYAPLSTQGPMSVDFMIFAIHMMGVSSIMGAINIIATILNMRAPGIKLMNMPVFVWTWLVTAFLLIAVMPVLAGCVTMLLTDRHFGTSFFDAAGGGDPVLFQHVFWFFGHPEVYILILPAFGVISEILPTFSRKRLFGYHGMIYATIGIALTSFIVWAHHMFVSGVPLVAELFFMYATMLVAVPTGVKVFNWVATLYRGSITFETPMLFSLAFLLLFTFGGFSGLMLSIAPADHQYHDTYFVVAHFHYVLVAGAILSLIASVYYWLPKWTGHMYCEKLGKLHFWLTFISVNVTFFPMHFVGLAGMPRRIPDYAIQFVEFNRIASVGAFIFGFSQLLFLYIVIKAVRGGEKASARPWEGARGLEWTVPSPAPYHTFDEPPAQDVIDAEMPLPPDAH